MAKQAPTQSNALSPRQLDLMITKMLREQTPLYTKTLGTYTGALGQTARIKLQNVGLTTTLRAIVTVNTTIATAPVALGAKGLEAFVPRVSLSDFDGTLRHNVSAYHLKLRNSLRKKYPRLFNTTMTNSTTSNVADYGGRVAPLVSPSFTGTVGTSNQQFLIEIPVVRDFERGDYRGLLNTQTTQGDVFLNLDFCSAGSVIGTTPDDDKVFFSVTGTCTVNSISIEVIQQYHMVQQLNGVVTLPQYSTSVVYSLEGYTRTSDNIAAGIDKLIAFPNARIISGLYMTYVNNARLAGGSGISATDMARVKLIANAGNYLKDQSITAQYMDQREILGFDLNAGVYVFDFEPSPLETSIYGNIQAALTPAATVTAPSIEFTFESLYLKGAALSGINQSS